MDEKSYTVSMEKTPASVVEAEEEARESETLAAIYEIEEPLKPDGDVRQNVPIASHPLVGERFTYRPDQVPVTDVESESGTLIVAPGMEVEVRSVFEHWNNVPNLIMFYVRVKETGYTTHCSPCEIGSHAMEALLRTDLTRGIMATRYVTGRFHHYRDEWLRDHA